jgi:DNA-binding beta-propeller fold protein YncE
MLKQHAYALSLLLIAFQAHAYQESTDTCLLDGNLCEFIEFSRVPAALDMPCSTVSPEIVEQDQILVYTLTNNANMTVLFDLDLSTGTDGADIAILSSCTLVGSNEYSINPFDTCIVEVLIQSTECPILATQYIVDTIDRVLTVTPITVPQAPFSEEISFLVADANSQLAYIADIDGDSIWQCPINYDGSINEGMCVAITDPTFSNPIDVILNNDATKAYVANTDTQGISVCDVDNSGDFSNCTLFTDNAIDLAFTGLRLNSDNTALYVTDFDSNTVATCTVNPDGSLQSACVVANLSHTGSGPIGRVGLDFFIDRIFVANFLVPNNDTINHLSVCDDNFDYCTNFTDPTLIFPLGLDVKIDFLGINFLYIPDVQIADNCLSSPSISLCPASYSGEIESCSALTDMSFDFSASSAAINLYMNNFNSIGYIPNADGGTVSLCFIEIFSGEFFGACHVTDAIFNSPTSVWIATFPYLNP